jgi:hypothetical protein
MTELNWRGRTDLKFHTRPIRDFGCEIDILNPMAQNWKEDD